MLRSLRAGVDAEIWRDVVERRGFTAIVFQWFAIGAGGILLGSVIMFSTLGSRLVVPELFLGLMMLVTTPVTLMVLGRAALHRDRAEGRIPHDPSGPAG